MQPHGIASLQGWIAMDWCGTCHHHLQAAGHVNRSSPLSLPRQSRLLAWR